jgi:hypothetical protein
MPALINPANTSSASRELSFDLTDEHGCRFVQRLHIEDQNAHSTGHQ